MDIKQAVEAAVEAGRKAVEQHVQDTRMRPSAEHVGYLVQVGARAAVEAYDQLRQAEAEGDVSADPASEIPGEVVETSVAELDDEA